MKLWYNWPTPMLASTTLILLIITILPISITQMMNEHITILEWNLLLCKSLTFKLQIVLDKISLTFSTTVMTISLSVMFFSTTYMSEDKSLTYFITVVLLFVLSMNFLIFFPNLIMVMIGWDGLGLTSYLLVIFYLNDKSMSAGMMTAITNRIGDSLLIVACSWCFMCGHWSFSYSEYKISYFFTLTIFLAAMTKSAQTPFSAWLPAAMAAPTPVSALVHSSTLVTAGIYLMIRFFPSLSLFSFFLTSSFYVGITTCMMASLAATHETDLKKMIALSTLSQLGIMMMSIGISTPTLTFFHLIAHALFKALLFVCAGTIIHNSKDSQDIRKMGNISMLMPMTSMVLNSANMSLCGLPFLSGFYSKDSIIESFMMGNSTLSSSILFMMAVYLTSVYTIKITIFTLWSPYKSFNKLKQTDENTMTYAAYLILTSGATLGGLMFFWVTPPNHKLLILPFNLKILTLVMILLMGMMMCLLMVKSTITMKSKFFMSMWFLTYITNPLMTLNSIKSNKIILYNEMTWMEMMSGKGSMKLMKPMSQKMQNSANISVSQMLSLFSIFTLISVLMY